MSCWVLVGLCSRLRKEDAHNALGADAIQQLKDDIILLIKATGKRPPALEANTTLLDLLNDHAPTMDQAKPSPGEPKLLDLGLLREKVTYASPIAKAEKTIKAEAMEVEQESSNQSALEI